MRRHRTLLHWRASASRACGMARGGVGACSDGTEGGGRMGSPPLLAGGSGACSKPLPPFSCGRQYFVSWI